jgi:hypothetical protein
MMNRNNIFKFFGTLVFSIGILIGFFVLSMMVWGDLEASLFSSSLDAKKSLSSLRCPVFMSPDESGLITAKFTNPTDKDWARYTRAFISEGFVSLMREIKMEVPVPSGGRETAIWEVYPQDAAYDRIIFFRVYVNAKYPYPSLGGSCGIIMMDFWGLTGQQIFFGLVLAFLVCITLGILILRKHSKRSRRDFQTKFNSSYALAGILLIGTTTAYFGSWIVALLFLTTALLMVGIIIGRRMSPTV